MIWDTSTSRYKLGPGTDYVRISRFHCTHGQRSIFIHGLSRCLEGFVNPHTADPVSHIVYTVTKQEKKNPGLFKIEKLLAYKCEVFTHKAGTVFTERGLDVGGLSKSVDETHLAVKQRAGFHEVVNHLLPADLPVSVTANKRHKRDGRLCCWLLYSIYICVTCYGGPHWFLSSSPNLLR